MSASIDGIPCTVYYLRTSAQSLVFLEHAKNASFLNWKLASAWISFMDGHKLEQMQFRRTSTDVIGRLAISSAHPMNGQDVNAEKDLGIEGLYHL
jgi:hypothetical protein